VANDIVNLARTITPCRFESIVVVNLLTVASKQRFRVEASFVYLFPADFLAKNFFDSLFRERDISLQQNCHEHHENRDDGRCIQNINGRTPVKDCLGPRIQKCEMQKKRLAENATQDQMKEAVGIFEP